MAFLSSQQGFNVNAECSQLNISDNRQDFYPFYVVRNRPSISRRRSSPAPSVQSYTHRHRVKLVRRLVRKSGKSSIHQKSSTERSFRFLLDISNTLIETSWVWTLSVVTFVFIVTWLMFAGFWAIISIDNVEAWNGTSQSCLDGIKSFSGYLLFSIETQTTVGYGGRFINENCPEAIIGLVIQLVIGAGVGGSLICIVFLKMISPLKNRHSMVCFSKHAVICQRDGEMCLIFRVRDYDMRYECHTNIVAYLVEEKLGELSLKTLKLEKPGILIWPVEVVHRIDEKSPFYDLSAKDLILKRFEIVVVLEGECLATSYLSRTTTSYLSREIKWGYVFAPCTRWDTTSKQYIVDHKRFNKTEELTIPLCSAQRLNEVYDDIVYQTKSPSYPSSILSSPSNLTSPRYYRKSDIPNINELEEARDLSDEEISPRSTRALVHQEVNLLNGSDGEYDSEGDVEYQYTTFMDLSIEDLKEEKKIRKRENVEIRKKHSDAADGRNNKSLSGTVKEFFSNLPRYVTEGAGRRRISRQFEETDF